jgi:hypothetical protein
MDPPSGERSPRPLDCRRRDVRLTEERREPVVPLDRDMTTTKPTTQGRERDAVLGSNGIDGGFNPDNMQEPSDFADLAADSRQERVPEGEQEVLAEFLSAV